MNHRARRLVLSYLSVCADIRVFSVHLQDGGPEWVVFSERRLVVGRERRAVVVNVNNVDAHAQRRPERRPAAVHSQ